MFEVLDENNGSIRRIFTPYSGVSQRPVIDFSNDPGKTRSEFSQDCDINRIVENFTRTGLLDHLSNARGQFADLTLLPESYKDALNVVNEASSLFSTLPADVRERYGNDVAGLLAAVQAGDFSAFERPSEAVQAANAAAVSDLPLGIKDTSDTSVTS